jgi:PAT family beta-lactamase induction signal transducer AmpG
VANHEKNTPPEPGYPAMSGWWWVPTLYFAQGIPYVIVTQVSVPLYKRFGISNADIAWYTSLLGLAWVVKPLWGPLVDMYWTKRKWVLLTQALMAIGLVGVSAILPTPAPLWWYGSLAIFAVISFASATHDIAADGYYMLALDPHRQALFNGLRSTFWRLSMIIGTGVLVIIAGLVESNSGPTPVVVQIAAVAKGQSSAAPKVAPPQGGNFARVEPPTNPIEAGTTAPMAIRLAKAPDNGRTVAVSVSLAPSKWWYFFFPVGDEANVKVEKGDRLEFGPNNWDKPQLVEIHVHKNLNKPILVNLRVAAGNIPLAWAICIGVVGAVYLLLWLYHTLVMPKPALDVLRKPEGASFIHSAAWLFVAVGVPALLYYLLFNFLQPLLVSVLPAEHRTNDQWKSLMSFVTFVLIVCGAGILLLIPHVGHAAAKLFTVCSEKSRIGFAEVFASFFRKKGIMRMLAFLMLYRLADAMLVKMITPFMFDPTEKGGLGLSTAQVGFAYGTIGVLGLLLGGIVGSIYAATHGLAKVRLVMCLFMNVPILLFVLLAKYQPPFHIVMVSVFVEQFGYGFGFSFYMLYMLYIAGQGEHKTSHYALCTGFMALSFLIPGMVSGIIQELMGHYYEFFLLVLALSSLSFLVTFIIPVDPEFGKKKKQPVAA